MIRQDPVLRHLTAVMLYAFSLVAISIAWHSTSLATWLTATALGYLAAIAAFQAVQASWRACRAVAERRRKVAVPPSAKAPLWPKADDDPFEAYDAQQHAAAMAVVAAEPMQPQSLDDTAAMPIVRTGPTWGFGPTTPVVDAPPWLWTAPGRHGRETVGGGVR